jgi:hypothetical protein
MATLTDIVNSAFRETGIVAVGTTPSTANFDEAFDLLTSIITSLFGYELGENLTDVNYGTYGLTNNEGIAADESSDIAATSVQANSRLIFNINQAATIFLPAKPRDGARLDIIDNAGTFGTTAPVTINANGRKIFVSAGVYSSTATLSAGAGYIYRAENGRWDTVSMGPTDASPFATIFDDLLIGMLAMRLGPRYGVDPRPEVIEMVRDLKKKLRSRYRQSTEVSSENAIVILTNTDNRYNNFSLGR